MSTSELPSKLSISSLQNAKIRKVIRLRERRYRDQCEETLIEGYRELLTAIDSGHLPTQLFFCPTLFLGENEESLLAKAANGGAQLVETSRKVFEKISYRDRPDGLLGVASKVRLTLSDLSLDTSSAILLVAASVEKPGNLGSMIRSADGAGIDAVLVCDRKTDINNPNVIRASIGTLFTIPVIEATTDETIEYLRINGVHTVATSPSSEKLFWEATFPKMTAIIAGSEQYGLSNQWLEAADEKVRIPMAGTADSLNVATATAILLYEAVRQRYRNFDV